MRCCPGHLPVERTLFATPSEWPTRGSYNVRDSEFSATRGPKRPLWMDAGSGTRLCRLLLVGREAFDMVGGLVRLGHLGVI
jgi:hypothetical protein